MQSDFLTSATCKSLVPCVIRSLHTQRSKIMERPVKEAQKRYGMETTNDLLTVEEAANYLRVPISWVYERTRTRSIPVRKLGRHVRIPRSELLAWIEKEGAVTPPQPPSPVVPRGTDEEGQYLALLLTMQPEAGPYFPATQ